MNIGGGGVWVSISTSITGSPGIDMETIVSSFSSGYKTLGGGGGVGGGVIGFGVFYLINLLGLFLRSIANYILLWCKVS